MSVGRLSVLAVLPFAFAGVLAAQNQAGKTTNNQIERGRYIVENVAM